MMDSEMIFEGCFCVALMVCFLSSLFCLWPSLSAAPSRFLLHPVPPSLFKCGPINLCGKLGLAIAWKKGIIVPGEPRGHSARERKSREATHNSSVSSANSDAKRKHQSRRGGALTSAPGQGRRGKNNNDSSLKLTIVVAPQCATHRPMLQYSWTAGFKTADCRRIFFSSYQIILL